MRPLIAKLNTYWLPLNHPSLIYKTMLSYNDLMSSSICNRWDFLTYCWFKNWQNK